MTGTTIKFTIGGAGDQRPAARKTRAGGLRSAREAGGDTGGRSEGTRILCSQLQQEWAGEWDLRLPVDRTLICAVAKNAFDQVNGQVPHEGHAGIRKMS